VWQKAKPGDTALSDSRNFLMRRESGVAVRLAPSATALQKNLRIAIRRKIGLYFLATQDTLMQQIAIMQTSAKFFLKKNDTFLR
jgi:hypothetical protein